MSISTLESPASRRALADLQQASDAREQAEDALRTEFRRAVQGDLAAACTFAPTYLTPRAGKYITVGDVLSDALDSKDFGARAMAILANAAAGRGTQREAQQLIEEATAHWAEFNADAML